VKLTGSDKLLINFQMNGVQGPNSDPIRVVPGGPSKGDPFGNESLAAAREAVMQQDVKLVVERVDPAGTFQGIIYHLAADGKKKLGDLAISQLKAGLAYTSPYCDKQVYFGAEEVAKKSKTGYWSVYDPSAEIAAAAQADSSKEVESGKTFKGKVTYVNDTSDFYIVMNKEKELEVAQKAAKAAGSAEVVDQPRRNTRYLVQDWTDKKWYRALYYGKGGEGHTMFYLDSGVTSEVDYKAVRAIPAGNELATMPPVAVSCGLYGVKAVSADDMAYYAGQRFFQMTNKLDVVGIIDVAPRGEDPAKVTLMVGTKCVPEELLKEGLVRLRLKENKPTVVELKRYKDAQETAKRARIQMWRMGDPGDSEDDY